MSQPSPTVDNYLRMHNLADQAPAYFFVDRAGKLAARGGDLAAYGLDELKTGGNAREQILFLEGLLPLGEAPAFLSCVQVQEANTADIHILPDEGGDWVLLVDATQEVAQRRIIQQQVNEASLQQTSRASATKKPESLSAPSANCFGMDFLSRLDTVALEWIAPHHFRVASAMPEWFVRVFAEIITDADEFILTGEFHFLDNFLIDAETFWANEGRDALRSGIWTESDGEGADHYLEALAVCVKSQYVKSQRLLLIERLDAEYHEKEALLQQARDRALQIEARGRAEALLQQAHEELEERVAKRTAELSATNRSLQEQIEQRQRAEERISYLVFHDALTGLPNRALFEDRLDQALAHAFRMGQMLAVLFVSLDRFKPINETLGHQAGDFVLQEVTERLRNCLRQSDTLARFGGDEFALVMTHLGRSEDAVKRVSEAHEALKPALEWENHELHLNSSMGVAIFSPDGDDTPTLMQNAAAALHRANADGGDRYHFYDPQIDAAARKRFALEVSLRRAIENEEFVVHYQPRVSLKTNTVIGMEALVRWQHPERGLVLPGEFISLAEETGLIGPLGEWVLRRACADTKRWKDKGLGDLHVSANLSARQFEQPGLVATIQQILQETELEHQSLDLEITESLVMRDLDAAITILRELKSAGITISIDDFGSGHSSLSYLKRFPIDVLKIDRSFVQDVTNDPADAAIVMTIISLAHNLNLHTVAEGVETEGQLHFLRLLRCDEVQGNVFSAPLAAPEFEQFVINKNKGSD